MVKKSEWIVRSTCDYRRDKDDEGYAKLKNDFREYEFEIALIRKNNKLGKRSFGWAGVDKIIVSDGLESFQEFEERKRQINIMANALNKHKL